MTRTRSPFAIPVLLAVAALLALLVYGVIESSGEDDLDQAVAAGKREPAKVRESRLLGKPGSASIADYRGKVLLLNFWGSWCDPCKDEAPLLQRTWRRYGGGDFAVLGADVDDLTEDGLAFARRYGMTFPNIRYSSTDASEDFGTRYMPETFLIDADGRIAAIRRGPVDQRWIDEHLPPLLNEHRRGRESQ